MHFTKKTMLGGLGLAVFASVAVTGAPAQAADVSILDAQSTIAQIAPGLDAPVSADESTIDLTVLDGSSPQARSSSPARPGVSTDPTLDEASGVSFTIDYATGASARSGSFDVFAGEDDETAAYVQELPNGVRTVTAIGSAEAPSSYDYTFDVPSGTELVQAEHGYRIQPPAAASLGLLQNPWAIDAAGMSLPTSFSWQDGVLTQHVDFDDPGVTFPVLIDPAWTYTMSYENDPVSPQKAYDKLKTCFNCFFPVEGAPQRWPQEMQALPLVVRPFPGGPAWNFNCIMMGETKMPNGDFSFAFAAAAGHVDGEGSSITFSFIRTPTDGKSRLYVEGYIMNGNPTGVGRPAYQTGAAFNWAQFSRNIRMITITT